MKSPWIFPACITAILLFAVLLLAPGVSADLAAGTITHVYFSKDGEPYDGIVKYTVTCYGFRQGGTNRAEMMSRVPLPNQSPEEVYHYSATCGGYGCTVYEPYYMINSYGTYWLQLSRCDVSGEAGGKPFLIRNFSARPYSRCDHRPAELMTRTYPVPDSGYFETEEYGACRHYQDPAGKRSRVMYTSCNPARDSGCFSELLPSGIPLRQDSEKFIDVNSTEMDQEQYIQFLESCNTVSDPDCPGIVINGRPLKTMYEFRPYRNRRSELRDPCDTFLVLANRSLVLSREAVDNSPHVLVDNKVRELCDSRWTIPSDTETRVVPESLSSSSFTPGSPVESLYCTLLRLLGSGCR